MDGSEGIDSVDREGDDEAHPESDVCEDGTAAFGLEVGQVNVIPFLVGILPCLLAAMTEATHFGDVGWMNGGVFESGQRKDMRRIEFEMVKK